MFDYRSMFDLQGKKALVVGAGSGIGQASGVGLAAGRLLMVVLRHRYE
jgi:NAD(P)-dependent dehydrogenase (short-subunit alcohol dehydrogenase family)